MDDISDFMALSFSLEKERRIENALRILIDQSSNLPWKELRKRGSGEPDILVLMNAAAELASIDSTVFFRKREDANEALTLVWLGKVLKKARTQSLANLDIEYKGISQADLRAIATRSSDTAAISSLVDFIFTNYGIAVVFEKAFPSMKLDGVTAKLPNGVPVIGLSLRYARYDHLWFTLLHELAHVSMHYDQLESPIFDNLDEDNDASDIEIEANRLAADSLIPRRIWNKAAVHRSMNQEDLYEMAEAAGVHPAIAAGMVRKRNGNYKIFSELVNSIDVRDILEIE
ncbi:ImmA/IrrE family metallo-endopeptidase [Burkholderia sp. MSMB1826]|uniref:ImmA/IrrE family metallo-endopeptidase n=1 Tax=Burkholderia sp. MSMB1826 TaxID=1637875 RepID=UPI0009EC1A19|nr:ImmA/IrrE family metallo-endopeptidase [Burkholderia sp. MSMB1826]